MLASVSALLPCSRLAQCQLLKRHSGLAIFVHLGRRAYAGPGRPKRIVGEPSKPVKRVAKTTSSIPKKASTTTPKKASKPRAKPTAAATQKKKTKPAEKAARLKEKRAAQKERLAKRKAATKAKLADPKVKESALKKNALSPPHFGALSAWNVYLRDMLKGKSFSGKKGEGNHEVSALGQAFRSFKPEEREHYNHLANAGTQQRQAEYDAWLKRYTIAEIKAANTARRALNKLHPPAKSSAPKWPLIRDSRLPPRPMPGYTRFCQTRYASGDFKHIPVPESAKLLAAEWRALNADEKAKYNSQAEAAMKAFTLEYQEIRASHEPPHQPAAAAAAAA